MVDFNVPPLLEGPLGESPKGTPANPLWMEANKVFVKRFWLAMCRESRKQYTELPACPKT